MTTAFTTSTVTPTTTTNKAFAIDTLKNSISPFSPFFNKIHPSIQCYYSRSDSSRSIEIDDKQQQLYDLVESNKVFESLSREDLQQLVDASTVVSFKSGEVIFEKGDQGDALYFIKSGRFEVLFDNDKVITMDKVGDCFGELALLFGQPRAGTVRAATNNHNNINNNNNKSENDGNNNMEQFLLWKISAHDFLQIVEKQGDSTTVTREAVQSSVFKQTNKDYSEYENNIKQQTLLLSKIITKCPIFRGLSKNDLERVIQSITVQSVPNGTNIITQGEENGDCMYFVKSGTFVCYNENDMSQDNIIICKMDQVGDYFGELALLFNQKRAASIQAQGDDCQVWVLKSQDFVSNVMASPFIKETLTTLKSQYA